MSHSQSVSGHAIRIAGADLNFRETSLADATPTGRQIAAAAGAHPASEYIVLEWVKDGDTRELDLDETTDLRKPGIERFIVVKSDRTYRFEIDERRLQWPEATVTREVLLAFAGQDAASFSVWQERRNEPDIEVVAGSPAHLDDKGVERFYTVMTHTTEGGA